MRLIECYIENFGKLSDFKHSFTDGLNVINGENGYGKTTLSVFIKAMFFGLDESRKTKIEENDRKHYLPWNGMRCGGSLIFEAKGKKYKIERTFCAKPSEDTFKLYEMSSKKISEDFTKNIGEELFGIDEEGFERTVFLSEANLSGKTDNPKIASRLSELVGFEGDVDGFDEAVKLLESQRKTYHRRGGGGEIGETEEKITSLGIRINDLERTKSLLAAEDERLAKINSELELYSEERKKLQKERYTAETERTRFLYEKQYREMKMRYDEDVKTFEKLKEFFKDRIPDTGEVEKMREMAAEARRIKSMYVAENNELGARDIFSASSLTEEDYEKARLASAHIKDCELEREILKERIKKAEESIKDKPKLSEVEKHISELTSRKKTKNANKSSLLLLIIAIISASAGIGLGQIADKPMIGAIGIAAALIILIIAFIPKRKKNSSAHDTKESAMEYAAKYRGGERLDAEGLLNLLYELRGEAVAAEKLEEELSELYEEAARLSDEISETERGACEFLAHFPTTDARSPALAVDAVLETRRIRLALTDAERERFESRNRDLSRAADYSSKVDAFLALFKTVGDRPFDEINEKVIEYTTLNRTLTRVRDSINSFVLEHEIDTSRIAGEAFTTQVLPDPDDPTLLAKISELEKARTLTERQCLTYSDELSRLDELVAERDMYSEALAKYERALNINKMTQKLLAEAKETLTEKYLFKTKTSFDKYVKLMTEDESGDYAMNTSFGIMKNERGTYRDAEAYSKGVRDILFLASRFALIDSLYDREQPFIMLDDPFAHLDDKKLARAKSALLRLARDKQIIYFTCQASRVP